jgi:hypothetical protein
VLDASYYRYYKLGDSGGYAHGLKYVFNPASYLRLTGALGTGLANLTDAQVAPYADNYFRYDSQQRVTQETAQGAGDSQTGGGLGTYTFAYTNSGKTPGFNVWNTKTVVTNPDGSTDTVYSNAFAEVMLDDHLDPASSVHTIAFWAYNNQGELVLAAAPSAVTGYSDSYADLMNILLSVMLAACKAERVEEFPLGFSPEGGNHVRTVVAATGSTGSNSGPRSTYRRVPGGRVRRRQPVAGRRPVARTRAKRLASRRPQWPPSAAGAVAAAGAEAAASRRLVWVRPRRLALSVLPERKLPLSPPQ